MRPRCRVGGGRKIKAEKGIPLATDPVAALAPGYDAGHQDPVVIEAATWTQLARPLGQFVNDWIYLQAKGRDWPL